MKNKIIIIGHICVLIFGISIMAMSCTQPLSPVPEPTLRYDRDRIEALKSEAINISPIWENPASDTAYTYGIIPDLPKGLNIDDKTGTIYGTPEHTHVKTVHAITAITTIKSASTANLFKVYTTTITIFIYVKPTFKSEFLKAIDAEIGRQGNTANLSVIKTSEITNMTSVFQLDYEFNGDISEWDVSSVTDMSNMFQAAHKFNGDIGNWDVRNVTKMISMFNQAKAFNGDIGNWDVSKVEEMQGMFQGATAFNGDISGWDVSKVRNMSYMFYNATAFNQNLSSWSANTADKTDMFRNSGVTDLPSWYP